MLFAIFVVATMPLNFLLGLAYFTSDHPDITALWLDGIGAFGVMFNACSDGIRNILSVHSTKIRKRLASLPLRREIAGTAGPSRLVYPCFNIQLQSPRCELSFANELALFQANATVPTLLALIPIASLAATPFGSTTAATIPSDILTLEYKLAIGIVFGFIGIVALILLKHAYQSPQEKQAWEDFFAEPIYKLSAVLQASSDDIGASASHRDIGRVIYGDSNVRIFVEDSEDDGPVDGSKHQIEDGNDEDEDENEDGDEDDTVNTIDFMDFDDGTRLHLPPNEEPWTEDNFRIEFFPGCPQAPPETQEAPAAEPIEVDAHRSTTATVFVDTATEAAEEEDNDEEEVVGARSVNARRLHDFRIPARKRRTEVPVLTTKGWKRSRKKKLNVKNVLKQSPRRGKRPKRMRELQENGTPTAECAVRWSLWHESTTCKMGTLKYFNPGPTSVHPSRLRVMFVDQTIPPRPNPL